MIKTFIQRWLGKGPAEAPAPQAAASPPPAPEVVAIPLGQRVEVPAQEHGIDPALLDAHAVRVVRTLKDAGHEAYVVGGAVRDLLVGLRPKDFDVATDATPEQVKALFRRAFIIGRRFRLVHVVFGRGREHETIEVSTFRAYLDSAAAEQVAGNERSSKAQMGEKTHVVDASGRVLRDNVWGPQVEDAARRDFTVNAMYYDPVRQLVVDYHGGMADVRARVLRIIGEPATRYREDPVRIIRVVRFAAKLGFALDPQTEAPVRELSPLLANVPPSRLFDEMVKLLQTGHAVASVAQLRRFGLVGPGGAGVFPVLDAALGAAPDVARRDTFVRLALEDTDRRVAEGRPVAPSFLLATLLWHEVQQRWLQLQAEGLAPFPALQQAVDAVFDARIGDISGRGKLGTDMREIWLMQPRFERRTPSSALSLLNQPRFRAGYDFLRLRADAGEWPGQQGTELADWWEDLHLGSDDEREALLADLRPASGSPRARRPAQGAAAAAGDGAPPRRPRDAGDLAQASATTAASGAAHGPDDAEDAEEAADAGEPGDGSGGGDESGTAPRRRRRRRRRPPRAGEGGVAAPRER